MTDSITIQEFKELNPDNIFTQCLKIKVTSISEPISGETNGRTWKRQPITIEDSTGNFKLSLFNGNIGKVQLGEYYLFCDLGVDIFQGQTVPRFVKATTIRSIPKPPDEFFKDKQEQINTNLEQLENHIDKIKTTNFSQEKIDKIDKALDNLLVLEKLVTTKLQTGDISPNPAKVGMYMKLILETPLEKINLN